MSDNEPVRAKLQPACGIATNYTRFRRQDRTARANALNREVPDSARQARRDRTTKVLFAKRQDIARWSPEWTCHAKHELSAGPSANLPKPESINVCKVNF